MSPTSPAPTPAPSLFDTGEVRRAAGISDCGRYRYWLTRTWDAELPVVTFVMLNPSTADAEKDDPTIRRCIGFARSWGHGGLCVVNLFAFRATDPRKLCGHYPANVDAANDVVIRDACIGRRIIAAWGRGGGLLKRGEAVMRLLVGMDVRCLGTTKDGHPWHPLYIPAATMPVPFKLREVLRG